MWSTSPAARYVPADWRAFGDVVSELGVQGPWEVGTRHALDDWSNTYIGLAGEFAGYPGVWKYAECEPPPPLPLLKSPPHTHPNPSPTPPVCARLDVTSSIAPPHGYPAGGTGSRLPGQTPCCTPRPISLSLPPSPPLPSLPSLIIFLLCADDPYGKQSNFSSVYLYELFDLTNDPYELHNVFNSTPAAFKQLLHSAVRTFYECAGPDCP